MAALTPCPVWLQEPADRMLASVERGAVHHALLISGIAGIGKQAFSQWLAEALLCESRTPAGACGQCSACLQLMADAHPDYRQILPEGANAGVKVDTIRELVDWLQLTAGQNSYRVACITHANGLNRNAANSLLKTLEEPADNAVLILCAERIGAMPATVRSRCQKITLGNGQSQAAIDWLAPQLSADADVLRHAGVGPFAVLHANTPEQLAKRDVLLKAWTDLFLHKGSVGRIADSLSDLPTTECLAAFTKWTLASAKLQANVQFGLNPAALEAISSTQTRLQNEQWFTLHDRLLELHRSDSASFKTQTVLEGMFADIRFMING